MKLALVLSGILLAAPPLSPAAEPPKEAGIFYFDHDFRIGFDFVSDLEKTARSTDTFKIGSVGTEVSRTDGRRFMIGTPQEISLDELNRTTTYIKTGETDILFGGNSILVSSPALPSAVSDLIVRSQLGYFTVGRARADLVTGVTPGGKIFAALDLNKTPGGRWSPTINIVYGIDAGGKKITATESCFPQGMSGFSRSVLERSSLKDRNILISLGLGGRLVSNVIGMPADKAIARLEKFKTDITALGPDDLRYLWEWSRTRTDPIPAGAMSFICSNIEIKDAKFAELVKPYVIKELNGVRVAFVSFIPPNAAQLADLSDVPVIVKDPIDLGFRSSLVEELRGAQNVKLVVAIPQEDTDFHFRQIPGVDIVVGSKSWEKSGTRREEIALDSWDTEFHIAPAALIIRDSRGVGGVTLGFSESGALKTVRTQTIPAAPEDILYDSEYDLFKEQIIQHHFGLKETLLPDPRKIYKDPSHPRVYSQLDFKNIVVSTLKERAGAEIAFMKIQPFSSNVPGDVPASLVRIWLGEEDKVVRAWVPGSLIRALMPKFDFKLAPEEDTGYQKYQGKDYFAVSGLGPEKRISGLPVRDSEFYLAAFPARLLKETDKYPQLKNARIAGYEEKTLNTIVLESLEKIKKDSGGDDRAWEAAIKKLIENKPVRKPVWRLNLRDISLQLSDTGVRHTENFSQVSDSRLRTSGQTYFQGSGKLFSEFYSGNLRFDSGVSADYGRITLRPKDQPRTETESVDQLLIENELKHQFLRYNGFLGPMVLGPFLNLAYDTEFTRQPGLPKRKIVRGRAGLKLFEGAYIRELYTGLVTEQEYTYNPARTKYAAEVGFGMNMPLPGTALILTADGNYRNFARSRFDTAADLKQRLELNFKLSTRLYGDIMISPFFNFFLATGKLASGTATNIMTGFSLNYSRLFKLKY
ncbi:MAG: hypothetical protein A2X28_06210 [Elusimicrobia bacterium GWA2_56_46]|nr:MAG: hypothetical protein A2X28_06210 [Elusimicrobia bacterium GWA2_56_46]OGR54624.1 MAG: hypothetical protein A2X39_02260 [Elusimicrobia bacterium GWC2_56_31]HBB67935.1 hypothetical protein [Elusimicrobiota bacterium]HBW23893.1 hypothetical protein [Elusimicrobiota bacterium]